MIELFDGYYILAEEYDYSLCRGEPKTISRSSGKIEKQHRRVGYYGSVRQAIKAFKQDLYHEYTRNRRQSLAEAVRAFQEINNRVDKLLEEIEA